MGKAKHKKINVNLAIVDISDRDGKAVDYLIKKRQMPFKAAASYAAKIVLNPEMYRYTYRGEPYWKSIDVYDSNGYPVAQAFGSSSGYDTVIEHSDLYPAVQYVLTAIRNAQQIVITDSLRWMTPAQVESELGLTSGVVRQYIHQHRDSMEANGLIEKPDERTIHIKRGKALNIWGHKGDEIGEHMQSFERFIDAGSQRWNNDMFALQPEVIEGMENLTFQVEGKLDTATRNGVVVYRHPTHDKKGYVYHVGQAMIFPENGGQMNVYHGKLGVTLSKLEKLLGGEDAQS